MVQWWTTVMYSPWTCLGSNQPTETCSALGHFCEDDCNVRVWNLDTGPQAAEQRLWSWKSRRMCEEGGLVRNCRKSVRARGALWWFHLDDEKGQGMSRIRRVAVGELSASVGTVCRRVLFEGGSFLSHIWLRRRWRMQNELLVKGSHSHLSGTSETELALLEWIEERDPQFSSEIYRASK